MEEKNLTKCKDCGQLKYRILLGKFDEYNKKWSDESGKLWNGKRCPTCHRTKIQQQMKVKRANKI